MLTFRADKTLRAALDRACEEAGEEFTRSDYIRWVLIDHLESAGFLPAPKVGIVEKLDQFRRELRSRRAKAERDG